MSKNVSFQYSILHYRHDISTGEILNIGLVLYSEDASLFIGKVTTKYQRISKTFPGADINFLRKYLYRIQSKFTYQSKFITETKNCFEFIKQKSLSSVLLDVIQPDDSSVFFGEIKVGLLPFDSLNTYFDQLYYKMIEQYQTTTDRSSRTDDDVWDYYKREMSVHSYINYLKPTSIRTKYSQVDFEHGWKNGRWNIMQPLSFDLINRKSIKKKSHEWFGILNLLNPTNQISKIYLLLGEPKQQSKDAQDEYEISKKILSNAETQYKVEIIEEHNAEYFAKTIKPEIEKDLNITN